MARRLLAEQQPSDYQLASGDLVSSPLAAALDPRVDEQLVKEQMQDEPLAEAATAQSESTLAGDNASLSDNDALTADSSTNPNDTELDTELVSGVSTDTTTTATTETRHNTTTTAAPTDNLHSDSDSTLERAAKANKPTPGV
jgi:hypothetical protein